MFAGVWWVLKQPEYVGKIITVYTILQMSAGIPVCWKVYKNKSSANSSVTPFIVSLVSASCWLRYGFLITDLPLIATNVAAVTIYSLYSFVFYIYTYPRNSFNRMLMWSFLFVAGPMTCVRLWPVPAESRRAFGMFCAFLSASSYVAPLSTLRQVVRTKSAETLSLPLCVAWTVAAVMWLYYGTLVHEYSVIIPNSVGIVCGCIQLLLLAVYRTAPSQQDDETKAEDP